MEAAPRLRADITDMSSGAADRGRGGSKPSRHSLASGGVSVAGSVLEEGASPVAADKFDFIALLTGDTKGQTIGGATRTLNYYVKNSMSKLIAPLKADIDCAQLCLSVAPQKVGKRS